MKTISLTMDQLCELVCVAQDRVQPARTARQERNRRYHEARKRRQAQAGEGEVAAPVDTEAAVKPVRAAAASSAPVFTAPGDAVSASSGVVVAVDVEAAEMAPPGATEAPVSAGSAESAATMVFAARAMAPMPVAVNPAMGTVGDARATRAWMPSDAFQTVSDAFQTPSDGFQTVSDAPASDGCATLPLPPSPPSPRPSSSAPTLPHTTATAHVHVPAGRALQGGNAGGDELWAITTAAATAGVNLAADGKVAKKVRRERKRRRDKRGKGASYAEETATDEAWLRKLEQGADYRHIPVREEYRRMQQWYAARKLRGTRSKFLTWLDGYERPLEPLSMLAAPGASGVSVASARAAAGAPPQPAAGGFFAGTSIAALAERHFAAMAAETGDGGAGGWSFPPVSQPFWPSAKAC